MKTGIVGIVLKTVTRARSVVGLDVGLDVWSHGSQGYSNGIGSMCNMNLTLAGKMKYGVRVNKKFLFRKCWCCFSQRDFFFHNFMLFDNVIKTVVSLHFFLMTSSK